MTSIKKPLVKTAVKKPVIKKQAIKKFKKYFLRIRSKQKSINGLRKKILLPCPVLYRHGSTTEIINAPYKLEINSIQSIKTSSSKFLMKEAFRKAGVKSPEYFFLNNSVLTDPDKNVIDPKTLDFPLIAKKNYGARGEGMILLLSLEDYEEFLKGNTAYYYLELFYNYNREYRLHVTEDGCFYTCRKLLKSDTPQDQRWYRNDSNCVWIIEENPQFSKPSNWKQIEEECVKALKAVGLDIGAVDLRVQSNTDSKGNVRETPEFVVIEINSAPSMGDITLEKYTAQIPLLVNKKLSINV
jgi:carbamoylphosphate synthase large subunit